MIQRGVEYCIGSYVDVIGDAKGARPVVGNSLSNVGPLLYNPRAFVAPRGLSFGNSGRNYLNNPSRINFNAALLKHLKVLNEHDLEFRAEVFNVFNHTNFTGTGFTNNNGLGFQGNVQNSNFGQPTNRSFGTINQAQAPREIQFGLKFTF